MYKEHDDNELRTKKTCNFYLPLVKNNKLRFKSKETNMYQHACTYCSRTYCVDRKHST